MATIKNVELLDNIRTDALILMKQNPSISYSDAYNKAKEALINNQKITEYEYKPFTVDISDELLDKKVKNVSEEEYYSDIKNLLKDKVNISDFSNEQLKQLAIATKMEIDIQKIADKNYSPEQMRVLAALLSSGVNVDKYLGDYSFKPSDIFLEL